MEKVKSRRDDHALIAPTLQDDNNRFDKRSSDTHHTKSIYFDEDNEYVESFNLNQDEYYSKIIENFNGIGK